MKDLGSEVARQPEGEVVQQAKGSRPTQPDPNSNHDRTGRPVVCSERAHLSQEIETRFSREEAENHDRTGETRCLLTKSVYDVSHVTARTSIWKKKQITIERGRPVVRSQAERSMLNEVDIDFRISGLPHFFHETS